MFHQSITSINSKIVEMEQMIFSRFCSVLKIKINYFYICPARITKLCFKRTRLYKFGKEQQWMIAKFVIVTLSSFMVLYPDCELLRLL